MTENESIMGGIDMHFQTPMDVANYMVSLLPMGVNKVLEPTPGSGNIVAALGAFDVTAPSDFFLLKPDVYDAVLMNPPFSSKYAFLENAPIDFTKHGMRFGYHILTECMKMSNVVIALMPWFTLLNSDVRLHTIKQYGLKSVTALPRKVFQYSRIQTVILELRRGYRGKTRFIVYDINNQRNPS